MSACSLFDIGSRPKEPAWAFQTSWIPLHGKADPNSPGGRYDSDGNYIPPAEVEMTYRFPDVHAGSAVQISGDASVTPTINIELAEVKIPHLRWWMVTVGTGDDLVLFYVGKRLTSIYEVGIGPWIGKDLKLHREAWGVQLTLIKF